MAAVAPAFLSPTHVKTRSTLRTGPPSEEVSTTPPKRSFPHTRLRAGAPGLLLSFLSQELAF